MNFTNGWLRLRTIFITRKKRIMNKIVPVRSGKQLNFIILCQPRTGSTLLHTYLNSHPNIYSYGEILRRSSEKKQQINLFSDVFGQHSPAVKSVGLKIFYAYRDHPEFCGYFREIADNKEIRIIHLTRDDLLSSFLSLKRAEKTQIWSTTGEKNREQHTNFQPDPEDFKQYLLRNEEESNIVKQLFRNHDMLEVNYESLSSQPDLTLRKVQIFLEVPEKKLFSILKKQSGSTKDQPKNFEALSKIYEDYKKRKEL
ncbi:MAG: sulfotransferase [Cyclobacteriaceae bacterium]